MKGPTGEPIMQPKDWVPEPVAAVAQSVKPGQQAFRWKDAEGVWQFSDTRPDGIADQDIKTIAIAEVMTVPKTAFTGTEPPPKPVSNTPTSVLISKYTGSSTGSSTGQSQPPSGSVPGQAPAMNDALAEIATRFPQFKAMSDAMGQSMSQPAEGQGNAPAQ